MVTNKAQSSHHTHCKCIRQHTHKRSSRFVPQHTTPTESFLAELHGTTSTTYPNLHKTLHIQSLVTCQMHFFFLSSNEYANRIDIVQMIFMCWFSDFAFHATKSSTIGWYILRRWRAVTRSGFFQVHGHCQNSTRNNKQNMSQPSQIQASKTKDYYITLHSQQLPYTSYGRLRFRQLRHRSRSLTYAAAASAAHCSQRPL
jgi:hypothetical protein